MQVSYGNFSGTLKVVYIATQRGPLKWNLAFTPGFSGKYRLLFSWLHASNSTSLSVVSKLFRVEYSLGNYTFDWNDVPSSLNTNATSLPGRFTLAIDLGTITKDSTVSVDPTIASYVDRHATAYSFQRHVFYESAAGNYWVFYNNGSGVSYRSSPDGVSWSNSYSIPGWPSWTYLWASTTTVWNTGRTVIVATGGEMHDSRPSPWNGSASLSYVQGTILGRTISWQPVQTQRASNTCNNGAVCGMHLGIWNVDLALSSDGSPALSYDLVDEKDVSPPCSGCNAYENHTLIVLYKNSVYNLATYSNYFVDSFAADSDAVNRWYRSAIVPADPFGGMRAIYMSSWSPLLSAVSFSGSGRGLTETVATDAVINGQFSAVTDGNYATHVLYDSNAGGWVGYSFRLSSSTQWNNSITSQPFAGIYPTLTVDSTTNDLYALAIEGSSIIIRKKSPGLNAFDGTAAFPVTGRINPVDLGSNYASASGTNSSQISIVWTEGNGPYNATFASLPIQTVWSPYGSPADPWDLNGLSPYGQYFANLGEYISPSTGMLTLEQTDLSIAGRGLNLDFTRVYTEPNSFFSGKPLNFESYPWAPIGNGWQLNFPWVENSTNPSYIHLWSGAGYKIPLNFWTSTTSTFENHEGDQFILYHNSTGLYLNTKSGTVYTFDPTHLNRLVSISDPLANNIGFGYDSRNRINCVTDTVNRNFQLAYTNALLSSIAQVAGTCSVPQTTVRSVIFNYTGSSLSSVSDPAHRKTLFQYSAIGDPNIAPWLISKITYPTGWYTSYAYTPALMGTQATSYRTFTQIVSSIPTTTTIRKFQYNYTTSGGDHITGATVRAYNGTQLASFNDYAFSFAGMTMNVSDSNHVLVRGHQQRFGVPGDIQREITIVSYGSGNIGSLTEYSRYDIWGNKIYNRDRSGHESFSSYYNDGLPLGFYAFADTFSQNQGTATDNPWSLYGGRWMVNNGRYSATPGYDGPSTGDFAWADIGKADLSIRVQANVTGQIDATNPYMGIFTHYPGHNTGKWELVLYYSSDSRTVHLYLRDTSTSSAVATLCPGTAIQNGLYTFNILAAGTSAHGNVTLPGGGSCNISASFPSSPVIDGTGFGLYAGGYSALFDNVTVATVGPSIGTTSFSNSFITNGAANSSVHGDVAGSAELQNGAGSVPIETYYTYTGWGGLGQEKHRLDNSPGVVRWLYSSRTYTGQGNPLTYVDFRGNTTSYVYSSSYNSAYLTSITQTLNPGSFQIAASYGYNFTLGTRTWSYDPNHDNATYKYDILGRVTNRTYLDSTRHNLASEAYTYNDTYNFVDIVNGNGWKTRQIYDGLGRLSITDRLLNGHSYSNETRTYDWQNNLQSLKDPLAHQTNYTYDTIGRLTRTVKPDGNTTSTLYDDPDLIIWTIDERGIMTSSHYDFMGRLVEAPAATWYYYDQVGNLLKIFNDLGQTTFYYYDNLNRLTSTQYPDYSTETYSYDSDSNLIMKTDRKNVRTLYSYDSLNRVNTVTYCSTPVVSKSYSYDMNGNLLQLQNQNATILYKYDGRNRATNETYQVNAATRQVVDIGCSGSRQTWTVSGGVAKTYSTVFTYNGEVVNTIAYPATSQSNPDITIRYGYDSLGRILNVTNVSTGAYYARMTYYQNDEVKGVQYGNGLVGNYTYDKLGREASMTLKNGGTAKMSLVYGYNSTGTVARVTGQVNSVNVTEGYRYDILNRLISANVADSGTTTSSSYAYDALGNRLSQSSNGIATSYSYNPTNNELTNSSSTGRTVAYSYDPNGNLRKQNVTTTGTTNWQYTWDPDNHLLKVTSGTSTQGTYAYDGLGRLVEAIEGSSTSFYAYQGTDLLYRSLSSSNSAFVYAAGILIVKVVDRTTPYYYHTDALGSTRMITYSDGTYAFTDNYQPYGQDNGQPTGNLANSENVKFTGKPYSAATGLYYYFQRWYDSSTGRFISQDPLPGRLSDPQSQNAYVYVQNIPTTAVDPTGMVQCEEPSAYCEGPGGGAMDAAQRDPNAICTDNPHACELCGDNPGLYRCSYSDPNTGGSGTGRPTTGDAGGAPSGDTGTSGYSPPPDGPTVTVSDTTPPIDTGGIVNEGTPTGSGNIHDIGPGQYIPEHAEPSSVIRAYDVNGELHNIGVYDGQGNLVERIDVLGRPHFVGLPHVVEYSSWTPSPFARGGFGFAQGDARLTNDYENVIIEFLRWFVG